MFIKDLDVVIKALDNSLLRTLMSFLKLFIMFIKDLDVVIKALDNDLIKDLDVVINTLDNVY